LPTLLAVLRIQERELGRGQNDPDYILEQNFEERDPLWRADHTETNEKHVARKQRLLENIFETNDDFFICLSTHSYAISAILEVIGAPNFRVSEVRWFLCL